MDRPPHDYAAAAMAFAQQQPQQQPQQPYGFHPQHQQFPPPGHVPPYLHPHPYPPYHRPQQPPQQLHPPPHPHLLHQQPPPSAFPPHMPPHMMPPFGGGPYDSPPPQPVAPPPDPELHKRIDKLAEYAAKNGPEFEAMIREKQQENPEYSFLFGGEGHGYYRYKLWLCTRPPGPYNAGYSSPMGIMHPPNSMMSPSGPPLNPAAAAAAGVLGTPHMHQPVPPYYDQQPPQTQPYLGHGRSDYDQAAKSFRGLSGPLPSDVAMELNNVLTSLTGTKDSIKSAKAWFMQRSPFAPALAEALRDTIFSIDDSEKQLHIIYLANDILFDSFQRRANPHDVDNEALAFKPVLGSMLARIYHNPQNKEENQSRLQKIVQFWATKEVYDKETISALEEEMLGGPPAHSFPGPPRELRGSSMDLSSAGVLPRPTAISEIPQWKQEKLNTLNQEAPDRHGAPASVVPPGQPFIPNALPPTGFMGSMPLGSAGLPANQPPLSHGIPAASANMGEKVPPYPLFPPGLIPGMVKKQQIGSGVPYSPMSPLDIPTVIPPPDLPESDILEKVNKFFKDIGEVNPSEGSMKSSESRYEDDYDYEKDLPARKGGACIPPPPNLQVVDPETGTYPDGTVERKPGASSSGRLGLGATADPNEMSQYDDVYSSYRKQRSTNYHTSMSVRAATK